MRSAMIKRLDSSGIVTALRDLTGQTFGRLTVLARVIGAKRVRWYCRCECGNTTNAQSNHLITGKIASCGCWLKESASARRLKHGASKAENPLMRSTYQAWLNMRQRCGNEKRPDFDRYGGKGVQVCDRWQSFENFLADMGVKPSKLHSIDRIDFTKGYEPDNCRWADAMTQALNKSDIIVLEYKGERRPLTEWCRKLGVRPQMVRERLYSGWGIAQALETPSRFAVTG